MPMGKGTYGKKRGRPKKKMKIKKDVLLEVVFQQALKQ